MSVRRNYSCDLWKPTQEKKEHSNFNTLLGIGYIPENTQPRDVIDALSSDQLTLLFKEVLTRLRWKTSAAAWPELLKTIDFVFKNSI